MSAGSSMGGGGVPTPAGARAIKAWTDLGGFAPPSDGPAHKTHSDGRSIVRAGTSEAAQEIEEAARAHEEMHAAERARLMRAFGGALGMSHAAGAGPWASSMRRRSSPKERAQEGNRADGTS